MTSYNNYLRTKNGNLCCCPGPQGPTGPHGVQGIQGIQGIGGQVEIYLMFFNKYIYISII